MRFGYLPKSDLDSVNLRSEEQLRAAISTMQKFANLPPTGVIDNTTLALMRKKRCGVPDLFGTSHERIKRYALQGSKWHKTDLTWRLVYFYKSVLLEEYIILFQYYCSYIYRVKYLRY